MPLPLILAGAAIAAGGFGLKKGYDAKQDYNRANRINTRAQELYDEYSDKLERARSTTNATKEQLGELKFGAYENLVLPFVDIFQQIKNVDFEAIELNEGTLSIKESDLKEVQQIALEMQDVVAGGIASLGAGGLAGMAAYGSVGTLATASTGTAIGSLSGVAATNATLAWLGGGSLASGGLGMAGGTAVLGGIVAGPVLAVGGMMLASKAEEAVENAKATMENAQLAAEEMQTAVVATKAIRTRFKEMIEVIESLSQVFREHLDKLFLLVNENTDYRTYSEEEKHLTYRTMQLAVSVKNLLTVSILLEDGSVNPESASAIQSVTRQAQPAG